MTVDNKIQQDLKDKITQVISADRLQQLGVQNSLVYIKYAKDNLNSGEMKRLEEEVRQLVKSYDANLKVAYSTVTLAAKSGPANLKTGHGPVGNKRPVPGVKKVIAVGSGKGGVGKSTFTVNLAKTLTQQGAKVGMIDADIYGPSLPMLLRTRNQKPSSNEQKKIIPLESYGMKMISFGQFIDEGEPVIWRGPMLGGVLNQFLFDVDWGELDYLIIDLPPGTGDIQLSMVQNVEVDGAIVICTPQDVALLDGIKGLEMFRKLKINVLGMVENMSSFICDHCQTEHFIFGQGGVAKKCQSLDVPFLGGIALELKLRLGSDEGFPYMADHDHQGSAVWNSYFEIAQKVKKALS